LRARLLRRLVLMVRLALLFLLAAGPFLRAQSAGNPLPPGPFRVGFRSSIALDSGRSYRTSFDDGATYGRKKAPRPILVNLWYPAEAAKAPPVMPYRRYFELQPADPALAPFARALAAYAAGVACTEMLGKPVAGLDEAEASIWQRLLDQPTLARPDARPLAGPFPFIVYHSGAGSSYEDNSGFCEYLASYGYVVLGSAYQEASGESWGIDSGDGSVRDMEFLARYAGGLPFVDWSRCAFGGHSAGAQAALRARLRPDCPADALFLLDTTLDYYAPSIPTFRYLTDPVLKHREAFTVPMLVTAGPEASFQLCDKLTRADRAYLTFPELDHNEFILQGLQRLEVRGWLNKTRSDEELAHDAARAPMVRRIYRALCESVRLFLDARLKGEDAPFTSLCERWEPHPPGGPGPRAERAPRGTSGPPVWEPDSVRPPTPRQLRPLLDAAGVKGLLAALAAHEQDLPRSPVYTSGMLMASILFDLAGSGRLDEARVLHAWLSEHGLDSMGTLRFLARMSSMVGRPERARHFLEVAVSIAPGDPRTLEKLHELGGDD